MPINSKKKKRRDRAKGTDDGEDIRDEIADKIEEQKTKKSKSKSLFTRQKNHLADLLEDEVVSNREIRASREKLDEAQENVVEELISLAALYSEARDRHALKRQAANSRRSRKNSVRPKKAYRNIWTPIRMNYRVKRRDFPGYYIIESSPRIESSPARDRARGAITRKRRIFQACSKANGGRICPLSKRNGSRS